MSDVHGLAPHTVIFSRREGIPTCNMDFISSIDFTDPLVIGGAVIVAVILVIIIWYAFAPATPAPASGPSAYIWSPASVGTTEPSAGIPAGVVNGAMIYVAAAPLAAGGYVLGKATSTSIWYPLNGKEAKLPANQAVFLPASIGTVSWSTTLTRGVVLDGALDKFVCRVKLSNGLHPGYAQAGVAYITVGGVMQSSTAFEYLNIA